MFKNKTISFYVGVGGGALGLVTTIAYLAYSVSVHLFAPEVFVFLLLGTLSELLVIFTNWKFATLIPVLFFSLAFGLHISDRAMMFEEMFNHIYGMQERGANLGMVITLLITNLVSIVACIVASFSSKSKEEA